MRIYKTSEKKREYSKKYYQKNKERIDRQHKKYRQKYKEKINQYNVKYFQNLKLEVFTYYSGGFPKCVCCGETHIEFLTIDHIKGGGTEHRRRMNYKRIYFWLRRNNYPKGFRVLCMNCNFALGCFGYCPHKGKEDENELS